MPFRSLTNNTNLDFATANKAFSYNKETGELFRRMVCGGLKLVGCPTGRYKKGRLTVSYSGRSYPVTHIIWMIVYGKKPDGIIEHKDLNGLNNKWDNLREATQSQNMANVNLSKRNKSGIKGVSWDENRGKWAAYIRVQYKGVNLGRFDSKEEAAAAYEKAAKRLFGEFART